MKVGDLVRYKYNTREIGVIIATAPSTINSKQHKVFWCALPDDEPADYQYSDWMRAVALEVISPT